MRFNSFHSSPAAPPYSLWLKSSRRPWSSCTAGAYSTAGCSATVAGTSSTTSYIESAAGVESGGRTGLVAVTVAGLFLLCLFFAPLAQTIPSFATSAALLFVACLMAKSLAELDWEDLTESAPAIVCAIGMPLSFSIADGIGLGFITYVATKVMSGRAVECPPAVLSQPPP